MSAHPHDIEATAPWVVDRRVVLGTLAATSAVTLLPLWVAAASLQPGPFAAAFIADWHIDDQWGPHYAEPIAYGRSTGDDTIADGWSLM